MEAVVHAQWIDHALRLWAERIGPGASPAEPDLHPGALDASALASMLGLPGARAERCRVLLPSRAPAEPVPSDLAARLGDRLAPVPDQLRAWDVPCLTIASPEAPWAIDAIVNAAAGDMTPYVLGPGLEFAAAVLALARHLIAQQRVVPMLAQEGSGELKASWRPWLSDEATSLRVEKLAAAMPAAFRSGVDACKHQSWAILDDLLWRLCDALCRAAFRADDLHDTVRDRDAADPHVAWMQALLNGHENVPASPASRQEMIRRVRRWIGGLEDRGASSQWRLALRLLEPVVDAADERFDPRVGTPWTLEVALQAHDDAGVMIDAADIWLLSGDAAVIEGRRLERAQELLLAELARAARIYPRLDELLRTSEPTRLACSTKHAYEFLRDVRPALMEQGIGVIAPLWWDAPTSRLGARLRLDSAPLADLADGAASTVTGASPQLGLATLVDYRWEIAVGDTTLSLAEFEQLAAGKSPLVRVAGRWVEIRPEDVQSAVKFMRENPGGRVSVGEAVRIAFTSDPRTSGLPISGIEATGWLAGLLGIDQSRESLPVAEPPAGFQGTLRPYQIRGMSWMRFLERFGLGVCLADDMGLGKTIQLLALMLGEREEAARASGASPVLPTLLIAPTSVLGNWMHETRRFAPALRVMVHHGVERLQDQPFVDRAAASDLVVTTYALANRDRELLERVRWGRIVLDEAQYIKNPAAKQSQAARSMIAERRVALTGTPVENRLSELWSIMEFLNPGFLGDAANFRRRFSVPIERYRDSSRSEQLKGMVRPFILRRLKTDPAVLSDLPEKLESKEHCHLTSEQASLYENCVKRMLGEVDRAEGIQRRGLVLSALIRLKQICNHPSQLLKDHDLSGPKPPDPNRSGKCIRLLEQVDEVLSENEQAIIFTQFRQMGHLLQLMLRHAFDKDILFLHGGTPSKQRETLIQSFQNRGETHPILILSLKAGGVGLNLTAATHVFHFDRWWNPAVENQATDRAYRIGQTRAVVVHKYLVRGTLEERIDQMIEQKTELAETIIGAGERWLTELSTDDLRSILALRADAIGDEP
ncbi:MAG: ATP-dependent helicase [Phycisphaerales bacterium]|nr:ATP-dependent helicase [Phycisphaerales bacterium]